MARQRSLFPGKACVYCGDAADTRDHVPPRCLLEVPYPANLPTVPSCRPCNNGFAADEEYFHVALAHVGFVPTLAARVEDGGAVDRTLSHSPGLDELVSRSLVTGDDGRVYFIPTANGPTRSPGRSRSGSNGGGTGGPPGRRPSRPSGCSTPATYPPACWP